MDVTLLADAVDATKTLFKACRIPWEVVVNHQPAELQVDPLASCLCCNTDLLARPELLLGLLSLMRVHAAVDLAGRVTPPLEMFPEVAERIAMLGEDKKPSAAVG